MKVKIFKIINKTKNKDGITFDLKLKWWAYPIIYTRALINLFFK